MIVFSALLLGLSDAACSARDQPRGARGVYVPMQCRRLPYDHREWVDEWFAGMAVNQYPLPQAEDNEATAARYLRFSREHAEAYIQDLEFHRCINQSRIADYVATVDLRGTQVHDVSDLVYLWNMLELDLSDSPQTHFTAFPTLRGPWNLRKLNLSGNQVVRIKDLDGLENLTELDLTGFPEEVFQTLPEPLLVRYREGLLTIIQATTVCLK